MMRIVKFFAMILLGCFFITSCVRSEPKALEFSSRRYKQEQAIKVIVSSINNHDVENLKTVFSPNALEATSTFSTGAEYIFNYIDGEITSWKEISCSSGGRLNNGEKVLHAIPRFEITTNKNSTYLLVFSMYYQDTANVDNIGVYALGIVNTYLDATLISDVINMKVPGICVPAETVSEDD